MTDNYKSECDKLFPQQPAFCTRCIYYRIISGPNMWSPPIGAMCIKTGLAWRQECKNETQER